MSPSQAVVVQRDSDHHRGGFTCRDCNQTFNTGKEFSDHFTRNVRDDGKPGIFITGCQNPYPPSPSPSTVSPASAA